MWPIWRQIVSAADTYVYEPSTSPDAARAMWLGAPGMQTWVAFAGGDDTAPVAGFYEISPNHAGPGAHIANGSYMVAESARGRGVGRALVTHSLRQAAVAGFLGIQFNAVAESNVGAIHLYTDLGFVTVGIVPGAFRHPQQGLIGLRVMYRDLADQLDRQQG